MPLKSRTFRTPLLSLVAAILLSLTSVLIFNGTARAGGNKNGLDPRLILHPHPMRVPFTVAGKRAYATFATSIPGPNAIQLHLPRGMAGGVTSLIEARMLHMNMSPNRATLHRRGATYSGRITFPMFGEYAVSVRIPDHRGSMVGRMVVNLPLPRL